jgi:hypothetical protein
MDRTPFFADLASLLKQARSTDVQAKMSSSAALLFKPLPPPPFFSPKDILPVKMSPAVESERPVQQRNGAGSHQLPEDRADDRDPRNEAAELVCQRSSHLIAPVPPSSEAGGNCACAEMRQLPSVCHGQMVDGRGRGVVSSDNELLNRCDIKASGLSVSRDGNPRTPSPRKSAGLFQTQRQSWASLVLDANSDATCAVKGPGTSPAGISSSNTVIGEESCGLHSPESFYEKKNRGKMSGNDPGDTGDLAFFLRTTGPPMVNSIVNDEHRKRKLRRLVALGKFRKRGEAFANIEKEE